MAHPFEEDLSRLFFNQPLDSRFPPPFRTERKLIVLHTGRCGSTFLHHHFIRAGHCAPFEIFNPDALWETDALATAEGGQVGLADYVMRYRSQILGGAINDTTCLMSYSVTPWQLSWLLSNARELVDWLFKDAGALIMTRRNVLRQAISYATAAISGRWHTTDTHENKQENAEQAVDESMKNRIARVLEFVDLILWAEEMIGLWETEYIRDRVRQMVKVDYETVIENPQEIVALALNASGVMQESLMGSELGNAAHLPERLKRDEELYVELLRRLPLVTNTGRELAAEQFLSRFDSLGGRGSLDRALKA